MRVDWDTVLGDLVDVETLYIPSFPHIWDGPAPGYNDGMLEALTKVAPDGTMLLPRLQTIVCPFAPYFLFPAPEWDEYDEQLNRNVAPLVREMLRVRALHGVPVTCMRVDYPTCDPEENEQTTNENEQLREFVASFIAPAA